jgi:hypothetical protein
MKTLKPTILLLLLFFAVSPIQAQFMDKLKKSIGNTLEDQAVRSINKGLSKGLTKASDKMWESMFGVSKSAMDSMIIASQEDPEKYEKMMQSLYGGGAAIPIADEYTFESRLMYKLTTESGKKSNAMDYIVLINPDEEYMATQMGEMEEDGKKSDVTVNVTTIMDYGNKAMVMIMEEQKMANVMSMGIMSAAIDSTDIVDNNVTVQKTGKTKEILGYTCDEYFMKSDDVEGSVWIATDVEFVSKSMFDNMGNSSFAKNSGWLDEKGMMMEMDMMVNEEKSKKPSRMNMTMISMDKEESSFKMADYQTMNFGGTTKEN